MGRSATDAGRRQRQPGPDHGASCGRGGNLPEPDPWDGERGDVYADDDRHDYLCGMPAAAVYHLGYHPPETAGQQGSVPGKGA